MKKTIISTVADAPWYQITAKLMLIIKQASTFPVTGMARCSRQLRKTVPILGWFSSHCASRGEHRLAAHKATIRNGVVGNNGTTTPINPTARAVNAISQ